jgi:hypothetical protein
MPWEKEVSFRSSTRLLHPVSVGFNHWLEYRQALDGADKDLGTSGIALLDPSGFSTANVARIGAIAGKSGKLYLLNLEFVIFIFICPHAVLLINWTEFLALVWLSDLGGYQMGPNHKDNVIQVTELKNSVFATVGVYPLGKPISIFVGGSS